MVSDRKLLEQVMAAWQIGSYGIHKHHKAMVLAMTEVGKKLASPRTRPEASFQGCCCRWQGNTLVQQCTLHQAHVAAIHEWAERAQKAEAELEERKKNGPAMQQVAADVITTGTGILFNGKRVDPASIYKQEQADPCPGCKKGGVCRTPKCGRLKLPEDHPLRSEKPERPEQEPVAWANEIIDDLHALHDSEMIRELDSGDALIRLDAAIAAVEEAAQRYPAPQPDPYDQTELELCEVCGWKTLIPEDCCLNCARGMQPEQPVQESAIGSIVGGSSRGI